jgi:hypothetical protein
MNFQTLLNLYLVLHITGFTLLAGSEFADLSISARLGKYLSTDKRRALILLEASSALAPLIAIGGILLILSGTGMAIELKGAVTQALWFRVKMPLVLLVILNGFVMARPNGLRLKQLLLDATAVNDGGQISERVARSDDSIGQLRNRRRAIYLFQLLLIIIIFVLSIFKF